MEHPPDPLCELLALDAPQVKASGAFPHASPACARVLIRSPDFLGVCRRGEGWR